MGRVEPREVFGTFTERHIQEAATFSQAGGNGDVTHGGGDGKQGWAEEAL